MSAAQAVGDLLFRLLLEGSDDGDGGPGQGPPPGSPPTSAQTPVFSSSVVFVANATILTPFSQIRGSLVHDPAGAIKQYRTVLFPGLLIL